MADPLLDDRNDPSNAESLTMFWGPKWTLSRQTREPKRARLSAPLHNPCYGTPWGGKGCIVHHFWGLHCAQAILNMVHGGPFLGASQCPKQCRVNDNVLGSQMEVVCPHTQTKACSTIRPFAQPTMWDHMKRKRADSGPRCRCRCAKKTMFWGPKWGVSRQTHGPNWATISAPLHGPRCGTVEGGKGRTINHLWSL